MTSIPLGIAFLLGLSSTLHCWGMCGGIIAAFSLSMPESVRADRGRRLRLVAAYNSGRILSYSLCGAVAGALGGWFGAGLAAGRGHRLLQLIAGVVLVLIGLQVGGWLPRMQLLEGAGARLWKHLQPLGRRLLPVRSMQRALALGMIWGFLPCGLVYSALLWSSASGSGLHGAAWMFGFGLGTLPGMFAAGAAGAMVRPLYASARVRRSTGILIVLLGISWVALQFTPLHALFMPGAAPSHH